MRTHEAPFLAASGSLGGDGHGRSLGPGATAPRRVCAGVSERHTVAVRGDDLAIQYWAESPRVCAVEGRCCWSGRGRPGCRRRCGDRGARGRRARRSRGGRGWSSGWGGLLCGARSYWIVTMIEPVRDTPTAAIRSARVAPVAIGPPRVCFGNPDADRQIRIDKNHQNTRDDHECDSGHGSGAYDRVSTRATVVVAGLPPL